jgi:hypothetical protein
MGRSLFTIPNKDLGFNQVVAQGTKLLKLTLPSTIGIDSYAFKSDNPNLRLRRNNTHPLSSSKLETVTKDTYIESVTKRYNFFCRVEDMKSGFC